VLAPRRRLLAGALEIVSDWCERECARVEWVRPDAGALCCVRLREDAFNEQAVSRFWQRLPDHDVQLAAGTWFGESSRVSRLGFGYLPLERLPPALTALSHAMDAAAA
ncbi:MAG: pyridoxal phosphate-dependent aminotransferase, partial [Burkholderia sp.]|nr:pyridoxal phosphate-dependent aminotransferase [Burkholderia sp.]